MAKLKLLNTIFSKLGSLSKSDGQIIVSRDSKSLYVDLEGERIEITDWIDIDTEETLLAILTPLTNKYYYTKDTNKIWRYIGGEWKCLNDSADDLAPTYTESSTLLKLSSGEKLSVAFGKISKAITDLISHIGDSVKHITSTERTNWNAAKTHADSTHAPTNAQANVIETVKVNGTALTPSSKAVNITVPTVGNGTVTIKQAGTSKGTFTMNQSGNTTIELTDNNTWRGIQNNLTSDSTTDSLSAAQGKALNEYKMDRSVKQGLGYSNTIDLSSSSYDVNTYYPVTLSNAGRGFNHIVVDVQLDSGTKPSWSTHNGGFSCYMDILAINCGWGTINPLTICLGYTSYYTYNNENPCGYSQLTNSSTHVVWLRGGGKYYLFTDFNTVPTVRTSEYTVSGQSVKPGTTKPFSFTYSTIYANVTNSNYATSAGNSDTVDGFHASQTAGSKSTCVVTDSSGYTNLNYINSNTGNNENPSISQIIVTNGSDNYYRKASLAHLKSSLGSMPASDVYSWAKASSKPSYSWSEITNKPSTFTPASHTHSYLPLSGGTITGGLLNIRFSGGEGNWNEGIRIHEFNNWATIALCSSDNTGDTGTSANTWSIHNNKGNFYITRNGSNSSSSAILSCINNSWSINNNAIIHGGNIASQSVKYATSAGNADTVDGHHFNWSGQGGQPTWVWGGNDSSNMYVYNPSNFSVNYANRAGTVTGSYTNNGGQQNPNYFGVNKVGFLMMNTTINGDNHYKDWIIMDCYSGSDVGGATAIGVDRQEMRAFIMGSDANRTSWTRSAELITTSNISSQSVSNADTLSGFTNTTTTGTAVNNATQNGHVYVNDTSGIGFSNDGACYVQAYSTSWVHQIYGDYRTGQIAVRGKNNGTWQAWRKILDSSNYTSYCTPANIGAATASHTHSNYLTGITKDMVTTALGYTPPTKDTNTWRPLGTTADTACAGNDSRLSNARPASDVYAWAKESSKPSYSWSEITNKPSSFTPASHNHELIIDSNNKETPIYITYSKDELAYDGFTYLTAWYGYELRKIPKTLFATASHTHSYLPLSGGTVSGTITADNLQSKNGLTLTNTYSTADASIKCYWKDNSLHEIVTRSSNGLSSYFGWAGSSSYSTTTWLRGRTCKYQNASGTATLSDVRMKKDFRGLDVYDKFFDAIEPCAFRMINGSSGRYHIGYKAQQIEQALIDSGLTTQDFAGFIRMPYTIDKEDKNGTKAHEEAGIKEGDDELSIIYTEFAAMNTYQIQKCKKEISNLKNEIAELKNIISNLNA